MSQAEPPEASASTSKSSADLNIQTVQRLAALAKIQIPNDALEPLLEDLRQIVAHMDALQSLDLDDVDPMHHPKPWETAPAQNDASKDAIGREDKVHQNNQTLGKVLEHAPATSDTGFCVPKIVG